MISAKRKEGEEVMTLERFINYTLGSRMPCVWKHLHQEDERGIVCAHEIQFLDKEGQVMDHSNLLDSFMKKRVAAFRIVPLKEN